MKDWLDKLLTTVEDFLAIIAAILILISMLTIVLEVFTRFFTGHSLVWVQEYNEYLLLYIPFLAGAWLLRQNGHVIINLIDNLLNEHSSRIVNIIVSVLGILAMIVLVYYSTVLTFENFQKGVTSTTVLKTPQVFVYLIIPIGSFFMLLEFVRIFYRSLGRAHLE